MKPDEYAKRELKRTYDAVDKAVSKINKRQKVDILGDIVPELKELKGQSYTALGHPGSIEAVEKYPQCNLGFLLGSGLYDKILVPLRFVPDKKRFEITYGLHRSRGCGLTFDQFLDLIKEGKLKITLVGSLKHYKADFYKDIFKQCDETPVFPLVRLRFLFEHLKLAQFAVIENIGFENGWKYEVQKLHPEYELDNLVNTVSEIFEGYFERLAYAQDISKDEARLLLANRLLSLRLFGFERLAEISLKCSKLDNDFGNRILNSYYGYLTYPIESELLAQQNYGIEDVYKMSFLKLIPKKLGVVWKDILSSSPASSSAIGPRASLQTVQLRGIELLKLIEDFAEDENAKAMRKNMMNLNRSLSQFKIVDAENSFEKIDEIVAESINSEIRGYARKGKITEFFLRVGRIFTSATSAGLAALAGLQAGTGQYQWLMGSVASIAASSWANKKLDKINPEDIVRWWSKSWIFEDQGIGFAIWERRRKARRTQE